jgi:predicted metal-dependent hydrolase
MFNDVIQPVSIDYKAKILAELGQEALDSCRTLIYNPDNQVEITQPDNYPYQAVYEAQMAKMAPLQKKVELLLALQPAVHLLLGANAELLRTLQPPIFRKLGPLDTMIFTEAIGAEQGVRLALSFAEINKWLAAKPQDKLTTLKRAEKAFAEILSNTAMLHLAARCEAQEFVRLSLEKYNDAQFKKLMHEELGQWVYDSNEGANYPFNDEKHTPSAKAIACLLAQAPASINKDPEGLIFHAMEQFRLRQIMTKPMDSVAAQIIKCLLEIPTNQDQTTLNHLRIYKRYPGKPRLLSHSKQEYYLPRIPTIKPYHPVDPLPSEYEYHVTRNRADGITATDVYFDYTHPRRRVHNEYTLLMIAVIYRMKEVMDLLLNDPRIEVSKTTRLEKKANNAFALSDRAEMQGISRFTRDNVRPGEQFNVLRLIDSYTEVILDHASESLWMRDGSWMDPSYNLHLYGHPTFQKSSIFHEMIPVLRQAMIKSFHAEIKNANKDRLEKIIQKYSLAFHPEDITKIMFEEIATQAMTQENDDKKVEFISDAILKLNKLDNDSAIKHFIGDALSGLMTQLFTEMQKYHPPVNASSTASEATEIHAYNADAINQDKEPEPKKKFSLFRNTK